MGIPMELFSRIISPDGDDGMNRERLKRLATLLDDYRESHGLSFDLQSWGISEERRGGFLWLRQHTCNTAVCAIGLACGSGAFLQDGLTPAFGDVEGWSAVKSFFDLNQDHAAMLFAEHSYEVTSGEAAAKAVAT